MTTVWDGSPGNRPARRIRFDEYPTGPDASRPPEAPGYSGRRAVIGGVLTLAIVTSCLALAFREWRARYRERAAFGAGHVATAIEPLAEVVPPGVSPADWHEAVTDARAMLVTLTAANLLDYEQMRGLRDEVAARVARARPETARDDLARLWDDLAARAGPNVSGRHPRPGLLPPARP